MENSNIDDNVTDINNGMGTSNSNNAEDVYVANNLNDTMPRLEASEIQVVLLPTGTTVCKFPLKRTQLTTL